MRYNEQWKKNALVSCKKTLRSPDFKENKWLNDLHFHSIALVTPSLSLELNNNNNKGIFISCSGESPVTHRTRVQSCHGNRCCLPELAENKNLCLYCLYQTDKKNVNTSLWQPCRWILLLCHQVSQESQGNAGPQHACYIEACRMLLCCLWASVLSLTE